MELANRKVAFGAVILGLLIGGCLSGVPSDRQTSPSPSVTAFPDSSSTTPSLSSPTSSPSASGTGCANWVSFYGLNSPGETAWEPDRIAIGYTVPANASIFFVAFEEGTVLGSTHVTTSDLDHGVTADGDGIPLTEPLTGSKMIRVGAYRDSNGNGKFDFGNDMPCRSDGEVVEAGPRRINFSAIQYGPSSTTTSATDS